jgi:hypothetical protein
MADEAQKLAASASPGLKVTYMEIAQKWIQLAEDIEQAEKARNDRLAERGETG